MDVIKGKDGRRVKEALSKYPEEERKKVKGVIIDRWKPFKKVAKELFPNALIIPNKFHLVSEVNRALDLVRKRVQKEGKRKELGDKISNAMLSRIDAEFNIGEKRKEIWGIRFLLMKNSEDLTGEEKGRLWGVLRREWELRKAYQLKENFRRALEGRFKDFLKWEIGARGSIFEDFQRLARSFACWHQEIRSYYRRKSWTNGFAEGMNNKIKVIKRRAFGFRNEENFRERILAAFG